MAKKGQGTEGWALKPERWIQFLALPSTSYVALALYRTSAADLQNRMVIYTGVYTAKLWQELEIMYEQHLSNAWHIVGAQ